jgi:Ca-activated chloride channel homolog
MKAFSGLALSLVACAGGGGDAGNNVSFGGAQDIGEFRGILDRGEIPGPDTLDANGFFNEHFNAPAPATCGGTLCLVPGLTLAHDWLGGEFQRTLQIAVESTIDPTTVQRLPMNLVLVIDHSGSMASDGRLDKVKAGLDTMIDNLQPDDQLAIVSFDDTVTINTTFTADHAALHGIVGELQPGGGTNIFDGLKAGFDQLGDAPSSERQNRVIFLSDGLATAGDTLQSDIIDMATQRIERGIGLTTIGVGDEFDVELMRGLAERGAGNFYYVEDSAAGTEVFTEELDYFLTPIALDLHITANSADGWSFSEAAGSRLWQETPTTGAMSIPAAFVASRTSQGGEQGRRGGGSMIFIHLEPTTHNSGNVANLQLSYRAPGSTETVTDNVTLDYGRDPQEELADPFLSSTEMAERFGMYNAYVGLRMATQLAQTDYNCAASVLQSTRANAAAWNAEHGNDPDLAADITLMDSFLANLREKGAITGTPLSSCPNAGEPLWGAGEDNWGQPQYGGLACSTGEKPAGWLVILGALLVALRRRQRRQ